MGREEELQAWSTALYDAHDPSRLDLTDPETVRHILRECLRVIRGALGSWWLERELHRRASHVGGILELDRPGDLIGPIVMNRLFSLAYELHESRTIFGFGTFVRGLRSRSLNDATAEMWAVRHCAGAGTNAAFVDPNAAPGPSPDAVVTINGYQVAVEVKARAALPIAQYQDRKITSTLNSARKQLPEKGPSIVYLRLSPPWSQDASVLQSVSRVCENFLANSGRVNAVVLMLERQLPHPEDGGMAFQTATLTIPNPSPRLSLPSIQG